MTESYSREELNQPGLTKFPKKGLYCEKCRTWIPKFEDLDELTELRLKKLIEEGRSVLAMKELESTVDCNQRWAKIWVLHKGQPTPEIPGPPCPYCGGKLRTPVAKQCPHCFKSWHYE